MRIFKHSKFASFAEKERIDDAKLKEAVERIGNGSFDADLGGGVFKQRIARDEQGKAQGYRAIIVMVKDEKSFFVYAFPKSERSNITVKERAGFIQLAKALRQMTDEQLNAMLTDKVYIEIQGDV